MIFESGLRLSGDSSEKKALDVIGLLRTLAESTTWPFQIIKHVILQIPSPSTNRFVPDTITTKYKSIFQKALP